jgi:hypothetical protein
MSTEADSESPEDAKLVLLKSIGALQALDHTGVIPQLMLELPEEQRAQQVTWAVINQKIEEQKYLIYAALHQDVQAAVSLLGIPDKKRSKLQRACAKIMKDIRKAWSAVEVKVRIAIYRWHPGGPTKANEVRFMQVPINQFYLPAAFCDFQCLKV